jgi:photosystem II stability/assembly factor-like uncharacterized protein
VRVVVVALGGLALSAACGSGSNAPAKDAGQDLGNVGAASWEMVVPATDIYQAVWLDAPGTIYAVKNSQSIASSHDDGKTWTSVAVTDNQTSPILSVAAVGPTDVYAVGYTNGSAEVDDQPAVIAKSTDRGATFTLLKPTFTGVFSAVAADSTGNPIGVGYASDGGFFIRSPDGGATWSRVPVAGTLTLFGLWTTASGTLYACGEAASASAPPDGSTDGGDDAGTDAGAAGGYAIPGGVVVRSDDGGNTWTTVTTAPSTLFSISGTADGQRIVAVGGGFTEIESTDGGATWQVVCGREDNTARYSSFGSVWVPDAQSPPFIAAGNAPYVVRYLSCYEGAPSLWSSEPLPTTNGTGLESGAIAVAGSPTEVWAVGAGIFREFWQPGLALHASAAGKNDSATSTRRSPRSIGRTRDLTSGATGISIELAYYLAPDRPSRARLLLRSSRSTGGKVRLERTCSASPGSTPCLRAISAANRRRATLSAKRSASNVGALTKGIVAPASRRG